MLEKTPWTTGQVIDTRNMIAESFAERGARDGEPSGLQQVRVESRKKRILPCRRCCSALLRIETTGLDGLSCLQKTTGQRPRCLDGHRAWPSPTSASPLTKLSYSASPLAICRPYQYLRDMFILRWWALTCLSALLFGFTTSGTSRRRGGLTGAYANVRE